jgi:hypothetical protein
MLARFAGCRPSLNDEFLHTENGATASGSTELKILPIALDIAYWLPEIAADSDMPREPWDDVNDCSARLVADYQAAATGASGAARREFEHANVEIGKLEKLLETCNPRWFEASTRIVASPWKMRGLSISVLGGLVREENMSQQRVYRITIRERF